MDKNEIVTFTTMDESFHSFNAGTKITSKFVLLPTKYCESKMKFRAI
jgi:hypothetical protein